MVQKRAKRTKEILAIDKDGNRYKIIEWTTQNVVGEFGGSNNWISGTKSYKLNDGTPVNKLSDTEFETTRFGGIIKLSKLPQP